MRILQKLTMACCTAAILGLAACTQETDKATDVQNIADGLSVNEFRAYGKTSPDRVSTRLGVLEFTEGGFAGGYPTAETVEKLYNEMDFQRATQAYLWALPLVAYAEFLHAHEKLFNAADGQLVKYPSRLAKQGVITANATTPYVIAFADLQRTGPLVFNVPAGPSAGVINDMWQRAIWDFGVSGPDAGKGVKILLLAPGMKEPADLKAGTYTVLRNPTNIVFFGIRALQADPEEAAVVGEAMAKANTFDKRFANVNPYRGTHWDQLMVVTPDDRDEYFDQLYRRAAFMYEAISRGKAYYIKQPGIGQQYRTSYKDSKGNFLAGSKHYTLTMPPNPPAKTFWSVVVYDVNSRTLILNTEGRPSASSRTGIKSEPDGSVILHFAPDLPQDVARENWIQTNAGEGWFAYLRFYGPTEAYFEESYPLEDIKMVQ